MRLLLPSIIFWATLPAFGSAPVGKVDESSIKTPDQSIQALLDGNQRFVSGKLLGHNYQDDQKSTAGDQHPHSAVLACLDSRVAPEVVFDQSIGDIFVGRVAGNVENTDMVGSLEFAAKVKGVRSIVVMGHTSCGAVIGACKNVKMGSLTALLNEIQPAVKATKKNHPKMDAESSEFHNHVSAENVKITVRDILRKSPILAELVKDGKLKVVGAMYDLSTGKVSLVD
jgi:carbonic anhydrase